MINLSELNSFPGQNSSLALLKEIAQKYCPEELAKELEAEGYMIDKPYPYMDSTQDLEEAIQDDEKDENAPQEWITKMFPELHV